MNRIIVIVVILCLAGYMFHTYLETGRISILPVKLTPAEKEMLRLEKKLKTVNRELALMERQAKEIGLSMAQVTIAEKDRLEQQKRELEAQISELRVTLETDSR